MAENPLRIILNTPTSTPSQPEAVPLQPLPMKPTQPLPEPMPEPVPQAVPSPTTQSFPAATPPKETDLTKRRNAVEQELQKLSQEENSLLDTLKEWMSKIQGVETKQQGLERELFDLDRKLQAGPSPEQVLAERTSQRQALQKLVRQAEAKVTEIANQQKIDEKKAFDNYAAGGIDRQGLMDEMEKISERYATAMLEAKNAVSGIQQQMDALDQTPIEPNELERVTPAMLEQVVNPTPITPVETTSEPMAKPEPEVTLPTTEPIKTPVGGLAAKLVNLPGFTTPVTLIERSADGNGVIINQELFIADADLLRVNATAEDIIPLPVSTKSTQDVKAFILS